LDFSGIFGKIGSRFFVNILYFATLLMFGLCFGADIERSCRFEGGH
jgi:hypothetical protein